MRRIGFLRVLLLTVCAFDCERGRALWPTIHRTLTMDRRPMDRIVPGTTASTTFVYMLAVSGVRDPIDGALLLADAALGTARETRP